MKVIANKIGKTDWGFQKDPCSGQGNWVSPIDDYYGLTISSSVYCVCQVTANVSTCHIDYMYVPSILQDLYLIFLHCLLIQTIKKDASLRNSDLYIYLYIF